MIPIVVLLALGFVVCLWGPFSRTDFGRKVIGTSRLVYLLVNVRFAQFLRMNLGVYVHFSDYFEMLAKKHGHRIALINAETNDSVTYSQYDMSSNQFAHFGIQLGLKKNDAVAVFMNNSFEFLYCWIGMSKIGVISGLINTNLSGKPLIHSLNLALENSKNKFCFVSFDLIHQFNDLEVKQCISESSIKLIVIGPSTEYIDSLGDVAKMETVSPNTSKNNQSMTWNDPMLLIYTSGTTGMPKASKISSGRFILSGLPMQLVGAFSSSDRIYCALPLYHSGGGLVVVSCAMQCGGSIVIRKKFSVSNFAREFVEHKCTTVQYIGEFCRYLVNSPPTDYDTQVSIRLAYGNGMRSEVWTKFVSKYNIKRVLEMYGSTEGNVMLFNVTGKVGALGYIPPFVDALYPVILGRIDKETFDLVRGPDGLCFQCKYDEIGHVLGRIQSRGRDSVRGFEGYTDSKATNKKICHHVLQLNDQYFQTGDLMRRDSDGYFYWVDRIGDTFRWKGENVSTGQVEEIIMECDQVEEAVVYGVEVPGCDGRAGMMRLVMKDLVTHEQQQQVIDLSPLNKILTNQLPSYARPLFAMTTRAMTLTSTFKHKKSDMASSGFDVDKLIDNNATLFYKDIKTNEFKVLTREVYDEIMNGLIKF